MRIRVWLVPCVALWACSSSESTGGVGPSSDGGAPEAAAAVECGDGTYRTAEGKCEPFPTLTLARSAKTLAPARDHHTTAVIETAAGPYLYVFGGTDDPLVFNDVQRASIAADATLGAFEPAGKLPTPRAGHCLVRVKDRFLIAGGIVAGAGSIKVSTTSLLVTIGADGSVESASPGPALPAAVMHLSCEVSGEYVYALGGRGLDNKSTTMSARAHINEDGSLGPFEAQTPLTPDRSHHASFIRGGRLYVLGGLTGNPASGPQEHSDAIMTRLGDDGSLGRWEPAGKLPTTLSVTAAQLYKDAVYILGGLEDGTTFTDRVRRATFEADGTLSAFATLPVNLPAARGHVHQTPMWKNFVFSVGGRGSDEDSLGSVDVGRFE